MYDPELSSRLYKYNGERFTLWLRPVGIETERTIDGNPLTIVEVVNVQEWRQRGYEYKTFALEINLDRLRHSCDSIAVQYPSHTLFVA